MANGLATTLQSIRRGGPNIANTLAGQISDRRRAVQEAQVSQQMDLRELMHKEAEAESEARRRAVQSETDIDEMQRERDQRLDKIMFGFTQGAASLKDDPRRLTEYLRKRPRLSAMAGIDPTAPDPTQIEALRDQFRARVEGDVPGQEEFAKFVRADSEIGRELNLDRNMEVKYTGGELTRENILSGEVNVTGFEHVGPQREAEEPRFSQEVAGIKAGAYGEAAKKARGASQALGRLGALEQGLLATTEGGFKTGFLGEFRQLASQAFDYFNVDPGIVNLGEASSSEIIDSISGRLAVDLAESLSRPTNMQVRLIKRAVPNLAKTVQGNLILTNILQREAQRDLSIGRIADAFMANSENGVQLDRPVHINGMMLEKGATFQEAVDKYDDSQTEFDEATKRYIRKSAKYGTARMAPTGAGGTTIDVDAMEKNQVYLMPDGRIVKYRGGGNVDVIDDLNQPDEEEE